MSGKGDTPRPVDKAKYEQNYDRIFGKHCRCLDNGRGYPVQDFKTTLCRRCGKEVKRA